MYSPNMFAEKVLELFRRHIAETFGGNMAAASRAYGVHITTLEKWLKGTRDPGLNKIGPVLDMMGVAVQEKSAPLQPSGETATNTELNKLLEENQALRAALQETTSERDMLKGAVQVLKEEMARLAPTPASHPKKDLLAPFDCCRGDSKVG